MPDANTKQETAIWGTGISQDFLIVNKFPRHKREIFICDKLGRFQMWITEYDNEFGFGIDKRSYIGDFIQVSRAGRIEDSGEINIVHFTRGGFKWAIQNKQKYLKFPFLMSSNLVLNHIFSGNVHLTPSAEAVKTITKFPNSNFPITSEHCIANLNIKDGQFYYMDIFLDKKYNQTEILKERFCFSGFTEGIGIIKFIN